MNRKITRIVAYVVILCGILLMCYPSFANFINQQFTVKEIEENEEQIENTSDDKIAEILKLAQAYNDSLPVDFSVDPITGKTILDLTGTEFENLSMLQEGNMVAYVEIPSIDVYLPIYFGTGAESLQKGAGLVENTSLPIGGEGTHAVISAHTGLAARKLFTDLDQIEEGEYFFIHVLNMNLAYKVDQIKVVLPDETEDLQIQEGKDYVTLVTCTPFGINDHRILIRGERTDYNFEEEENNTPVIKVRKLDFYSWIYILCILLLLIVIISTIRRYRKKQKLQKSRKDNPIEKEIRSNSESQ